MGVRMSGCICMVFFCIWVCCVYNFGDFKIVIKVMIIKRNGKWFNIVYIFGVSGVCFMTIIILAVFVIMVIIRKILLVFLFVFKFLFS